MTARPSDAAPAQAAPSIPSAEDEVNALVAKAQTALKAFEQLDQAQVDHIVAKASVAALNKHLTLAKLAVEETGRGLVEDKATKNLFACEHVTNHLAKQRTVGVINDNDVDGIVEIAEPVGVVAGVTPVTNPTSTAIFKSLIALKTRCPIVFGFHPGAQRSSAEAARIVRDAAIEAGAPADCIQWIEHPSIEATGALMKHPGVATILATGGPGMVKAAYSSGKPALGVGAGNSPAYIERTADVPAAVRRILASKTFDNGTICASEQSVICETVNRDEVVAEFKRQGAYFLTEDECHKVCQLLFRNGHSMSPKFVGRSPKVIADAAGIHIPDGTRVLIGEQHGVGDKWPLSYEKLTTVLGFYTVSNWEEACDLSIALLQNGIGHTMSIHTESKDIVRKFSVKPASRILINTGGTQGGTGASTGLDVALTLGCGTWGGSSVSENVGPQHLINVKRVVNGLVEPDELVAHDELFAKWHPELAAKAGNHGAPVASDAGAGATCCSAAEAEKPHGVSGIEYSLGCNCGCGSTPNPNVERKSDVIDAEELQKMINELVNAFKGE